MTNETNKDLFEPVTLDSTVNTETGAAVEIAMRFGDTEQLPLPTESAFTPVLLSVPAGRRLVSAKRYYDQYRVAPERKTGLAQLTDLKSFIAHANRFKDGSSAIFAKADPRAPELVSVLNYHWASNGQPRFGDHRGIYRCPVSEEWKAWLAKNAQPLSQGDFAQFVEDRLLDVVDGKSAAGAAAQLAETLGITYAMPSKLLETSRGLALRVGARCETAVNLSTGETQFAYVTEHSAKDGQPITVPAAFLIAIPVFQNGALYQMPVRLRYRLRDGAVSWFYELARVQAVFDHAFKEACETAKKETELPLFYGSPEDVTR